jgi:thiamine kinase-like enzyme
MSELITNVSQLTPERLTGILRKKGILGRGSVMDIQVRESSQTPWSDIFHLEVRFSGNTPSSAPQRLFFKIGNGGQGEVVFYNSMADSITALPVVPCYEAVYSSEQNRSHLLMKDLAETHSVVAPWPMPPLGYQGEAIASSLARLHAFWWEDSRLNKEVGTLQWNLQNEGQYLDTFHWWQEQFIGFVDFLGDRFLPEQHKLYERIFDSYPQLWVNYWKDRVEGLKGFTLIHGDAHPGNLLYPRNPDQDSIYLVDWQGYRVGKGTTDLAYMVTFHWYAERERAMPFLRRYHRSLQENGIDKYDWDAFWLDYQVSVINYMFDPIRLYADGVEALVWWPILQKALVAFRELGCVELMRNGL